MTTILVVEDDRLARGALKRGLETEGYQVLEAEDGKEAWEIMKKDGHPHLIITDKQMPNMDGQELIEKVRDAEWGKKLPILMLTGSEDTSVVNKALESGVAYFSKNITSVGEIIAHVRGLVRP